VKVIATNQFGDSDYSPVGSGAIVKLVPSQTLDMTADEVTSNDITIRFTWSTPLEDGGSPIEDYYVYYDEGLANGYVLLVEGTTALEF